jgi:hypothetical protein
VTGVACVIANAIHSMLTYLRDIDAGENGKTLCRERGKQSLSMTSDSGSPLGFK